MENQTKAILPMNDITEKIFYTNDANNNQRMVISTMTDKPIVWKVSKVETFLMGETGLQRLTFAQDTWNNSTDYLNKFATFPDGSKDFYAMYADYYIGTTPVVPNPPSGDTVCTLNASTNTIKIGGTYKTVTAKFELLDVDVTEEYLDKITNDNWSFTIDGEDVGDKLTVSYVSANKIKVKLGTYRDYIGKQLNIKLSVEDVVGEATFEITT